MGEVAARLGVSPSAVRAWGVRYGLTASARSAGGHRRYTTADVARLQGMHQEVLRGVEPAVAAAAALGSAEPARPRGARGGPGGHVLALPGAGAEARGMSRAATRLEAQAVEDILGVALRRDGTIRTWDELVQPVLTAAGRVWETTGSGIEIEHLLSQAVMSAFGHYLGEMARPSQERPVLLAGAPREEHVLPLYALRSALAEEGVPARLLGPCTPLPTLAVAAKRTRAAAVVCWASQPDIAAAEGLEDVLAAHRTVRVFVAGPGWGPTAIPGVTSCASLAGATQVLADCWSVRLPQPAA